ncbi:nucleotidyltransferase family protein [Sphingomonas sp.]|uniref:nucleotidyltransferase family protein n=1 Tax=Sphingomonas sp. TaxID=28214 RepID=UPI001AFCFBA6|nr:nucleotidyltransferase family protein [Sphingomonas sp.]MBO9714782.1 nucleotidyltransferase family protein [Sphingomonas sp.]
MWRKLEAYGAAFAPWVSGTTLPADETIGRDRLAPLVDVTERYGTGPALAWLLGETRLTAETAAYARLTLLYGRERAARRRDDLHALAAAMNAVGVSPLLLKGSAAQIGGIYPDPGFRLMADIDLLVPEAQYLACEAAAARIGFDRVKPIEHHHANQQYHEARSALLELHRRVTRWHGRSNLPAAMLLDSATPAEIDGARILLPDWTLHAVLVIAHSFVWDECCDKAHVPLKTMLDLAALRVAGVVSWQGVRERLEAMGERRALLHAEALFAHLFGVPLTGAPIGWARRRAILLWYRLGADHPLVNRLGLASSAIRRRGLFAIREPARLRKLLTPGFYRRLAASMRRAFDRDTPLT